MRQHWAAGWRHCAPRRLSRWAGVLPRGDRRGGQGSAWGALRRKPAGRASWGLDSILEAVGR